MGKRNWGLGFFRLWLVLALLWVAVAGGNAIIDMVPILRLPPKPPTIELAQQECEKERSDKFVPLVCALGLNPLELSNEQQAAEKAWRSAYQRRESVVSNLAIYVLETLSLVFLPPLSLLLSGLVIAWIARGFARIPHPQAEA